MTEPTKPPRPGDQPLPLLGTGESIHFLVARDLNERLRLGVERYGRPLRANNGRDALRDAYEEALDLACYLRQAIEERVSVPPAAAVPAPEVWDRDDARWKLGVDGHYRLYGHPEHQARTRTYIDTHYGPTREQA